MSEHADLMANTSLPSATMRTNPNPTCHGTNENGSVPYVCLENVLASPSSSSSSLDKRRNEVEESRLEFAGKKESQTTTTAIAVEPPCNGRYPVLPPPRDSVPLTDHYRLYNSAAVDNSYQHENPTWLHIEDIGRGVQGINVGGQSSSSPFLGHPREHLGIIGDVLSRSWGQLGASLRNMPVAGVAS